MPNAPILYKTGLLELITPNSLFYNSLHKLNRPIDCQKQSLSHLDCVGGALHLVQIYLPDFESLKSKEH